MSNAPETAAKLPAQRDPELDRYARIGKWLAAAESKSSAPEVLGMRAALRSYWAGRLGLPEFAAGELSFVGGKLVVSAKLLRGLAIRGGYRVLRVEESDESVTAAVVLAESGKELGRSTYTMEDAKRAGLLREGGSYFTHPRRMLWARASKFAIDDYAPDVSLGLLTAEEAEELDSGEEPGPSQPPLGSGPGSSRAPSPPGDAPAAGSLPAASPSGNPPPGGWEQDAEAAEWEPVDEDADAALEKSERDKAHARLAVLIAQLEENPKTPRPEGYGTWEDYSRDLARHMFQAESRSDLTAPELDRLREQVEKDATPF